MAFYVFHHSLDLLVAYKAALYAPRRIHCSALKQHVAFAQKLFRARTVQNDAGINLGGDGKCDAGGDVCLDKTRHDIDGRALRRDYQINAGGARFLTEADDIVLHLLGADHHKVGKLVNYNYNLRYRLAHIGVLLRIGVVAVNIAHVDAEKQVVAPFHLVYRPL